ncbi:MAG: ATP-dependent zinc metalloprotease FtsH [Deltaproteobacteria bacterium]|nr:ATP-dependent zinc metalloprotease FtsH [Deltaproteobacteria bacterium]
MNQMYKNIALWGMVIMLLAFLFNSFNQPKSAQDQLSYSDLMNFVQQGRVSEVSIQGQNITGMLDGGKTFRTFAPRDANMVERLMAAGVSIKAEPQDEAPWYVSLLVSWLPMLLLVGVWAFFMRQMQGGNGKAMSFGRSRARVISPEHGRVTFSDVAGVDEAKEELTEVVDFLSNPKKFTRLGGRIPKGVLLVGPPGTGKTLLAKAVAGEAGVPFFSISGSDFVEMFVGVGASRVRDLFAQGKKNAPCLIFIDEIDAVGRHRGAGLGGGHDEREQTLNQLLVEMDGFEANEGVILIAATNRPDVLDPALLRPGRFDRQVVVPTPDVRGRRHILEVHSRRTPLAADVDLDRISRSTPGMSGADLENLVNEAALLAAKSDKDFVSMSDFEEAKDKLIMGKARRTMVLSDAEKRNTAYHEAGHALVSKFTPESNPVHKITIIPRGRALGFTALVPEEDKYTITRTALESRIAMALGGRAAELIIFGAYTSGAMQDIQRATKTARQMVCELGMSDLIGPIAIGESNSEVFIGREWVSSKNHSEETSRLVDGEVKRIIEEGMRKATEVLRAHEALLHKTAEALLEYETISGEDLEALIQGKPMPIASSARDEDAKRGRPDGPAAGHPSGAGARPRTGGEAADAPPRAPRRAARPARKKNPDDDFKLE